MIEPLMDSVIVRPLKAASESGIILPDGAEGNTDRGEVIAVGPGKLLEDGSRAKMQAAVGDSVIFIPYARTEFDYEGEKLYFLKEEQLLGIIR